MINETRSRPSPTDFVEAVVLSQADLDEALRELDGLREAQRADADDELISLRVGHLERLIDCATVVQVTAGADGSAGLGSFVRVRDDRDRECDYELVGRRGIDAATTKVTLASPVGKALVGARVGDEVRVELPNGRSRPLTVVAVQAVPFSG